MPLGFERLNERTTRPNPQINFIKPLPNTGHEATSLDFLQRIAAQCYPILKAHHISVMSLEEYEPNPEFLGRNFNAGEVIQLVLKDKNGGWLCFGFVQMVMMHELAHCKEMNHGRGFWKVRNGYAEEMQGLWKRKYRGEGLWGRGKGLGSGAFVEVRAPEGDSVPEHLCGGTFRRRGRKRKRGEAAREKPKETYAERQQKRIQRKFGKHGDGNALGDDELVRGALEKTRHQGKPRVANSKRGRELRAAAALARFATPKEATPEQTPELDDDDGSETEWYESDDDLSVTNSSQRVTDAKGNDMVRVCGDEEENDGGKDELSELRGLSQGKKPQRMSSNDEKQKSSEHGGGSTFVTLDDSETESESEGPRKSDTPTLPQEPGTPVSQPTGTSKTLNDPDPGSETESEPNNPPELTTAINPTTKTTGPTSPSTAETAPAPATSDTVPTSPTSPTSPLNPQTSPTACPICSLHNEPSSTLCLACSHVLKPTLMRNHWRCGSETCKNTGYVNPGDAGRCGLCGGSKPAQTGDDGVGRGVGGGGAGQGVGGGVIGADVLRWD